MRVDVAELRRDLGKYLAQVRGGEEILVYDREQAIARITPVARVGAAKGKRRSARRAKKMDWDAFFAVPAADLPTERILEALDWARGED